MENRKDFKYREDNKTAKPTKQPSQGEYGDKPFQNPYLSDKPIDQSKNGSPREDVEVDLKARRREEEDPKFAANRARTQKTSVEIDPEDDDDEAENKFDQIKK